MSFYVTLPSDSSMHFFPENKISHFKTQLPSPVCLNGEWEVGLSEIIYPHSWLNVNETNNYFLYKVGDGKISSTVKRRIDVGCYETMLDIISAVQLALPKNSNRFTIFYNKATKRVSELILTSHCSATRGLLATDHVILNHGQVTWTTPELAPLSPNYHTTRTGKRFNSQQI
ncbi:uncharacterized protein TNCV_1170621 [Trichonephila clavipes]|nr:uncharacterized protein TNCV_1170621 [Trichonephila clavipes]